MAWGAILLLVYVLLVAVGLIGHGFSAATGDRAEELFSFATNPFLGLVIGTMSTALVQSSSTVTSIIVGMVGGGLPVATAVPMVMGANIGTTITNTLVSLGHVGDRDEFRRAFAGATVHDFFNLLSVLLFLPLELATGYLQHSAEWLTSFLEGSSGPSLGGLDFIKGATGPPVEAVSDALGFLHPIAQGVVAIVLGIALIFLSITYMGKLLRKQMAGGARKLLHAAIGRGPVSGIVSGTVVTVLVQSSSTTTSLMVPLVGSGVFTVRDIYPFTLGANIGTTITALLAATAVTGPNALFAVQIALVHLLYNVTGVLVIFGIPALRDVPVRLAEALARLASERRALAVAYVLGVFFVVPGALVLISVVL